MDKKIICSDCKDIGIVYNQMKRSESKVCLRCLYAGRLDQSIKSTKEVTK